MKNTLIILSLLMLSSCAQHINVNDCLPQTEHVCNFWCGVWHGAISQFAFIYSLFNHNIAIYSINNNGAWYNFGYVGGLGIMIRFTRSTYNLITED